VDGAAILMDLTRDEPPRFFFGFGSISGRWGSIGQADYALASEMLAKLIDWYRVQQPECHATCFHWHPWADVGMAVREETRGGRMLEQMKLMPADEGVQQFIDELLAGAPEPEVIVTDWDYYKRFIPDLTDEQVASVYQMQPWDEEALLKFTLRSAPSSPATSSKAPQAPPKTESKPASAKKRAAPPPPAPAKTDSPLPFVASRQVMRMVEVPRETVARTRFEFVGPGLIVGDNEDARALGKCLEARGVPVHFLPIHSTNEETIRELEAVFAKQPVPHLFLMTGREPEAASFATAAAWPRRRQRGVMLPFVICQRWLDLIVKADLLEQSSIVAATSLGGDFGFSQGVVAPEGGALTGLLKGIYMEVVKRRSSSLKLKLIDAPADEPAERLAIEILNELDVDGSDVEVAISGRKRRVVRLLVQPAQPSSQKEISRGGTWVLTGGARGITAAVAKEIGPRFGLKLHLLGMSPRPEIDVALLNASEAELQDVKRSLVRKAMGEGVAPGTYWERLRKDLEIERTLRDLAQAGVKATYHACDVANWSALETTLEQIRSIDGPIEGIIHGAGITGPSKALSATPPSLAHELIEVKVDAAVALMLLTMQDPVRYFVGFGSISGRFGTADAATYTLSNDMLCKLIGWYRAQRPGCQAVGFHWHPWGEVGMMTLPVAQHTIKIFKMKLMPPHEGAAHLIDELCAGAPESEVLITDFQFAETFYSKDLMIRDPSDARERNPDHGALIERVVECEPGRRATAEIRLH
ncbi:MAG TPA: SDR family NAD(P)-dependent oxidoreductase, partial [Planctomycetaceae bacterium]|nr:SDR family NAD(P)-dependent oxidoreductase [Planctomycetaceae bacterium]